MQVSLEWVAANAHLSADQELRFFRVLPAKQIVNLPRKEAKRSVPRHRGSRFAPPGFARRRRCARRTSRLSTSGPGPPSTSSRSSWSACARDSSSWSRPLASLPASATASSSSRRSSFSLISIIGCPPSSDGRVAQHRSRSAWRTISPPRSRAHIGRKRRGECRPDADHGTATRERAVVPAAASSPIPREPSNRRQIASHAWKPRRPCLIPCRTPAPFRSETRPGVPWTRRVARRQAARKGRDTFSGSSLHALRARTTRKTAVGILLFPRPTSLPPLPARPRRMRLTRRKARHRGGPPSLRSKT